MTKEKNTSRYLPFKEVKVLNLTYKLKVVSSDDFEEDSLGQCFLDDQEIWVCKGLKKDHLAEILLHEVIHAINWRMGIGPSSSEEDITKNLSIGLCSFFLDNKEFHTWWKKILN